MEFGLVNKAQSSLTTTAGLDRLIGMNAASSRKRASNTAIRLRLHRVGATNPLCAFAGADKANSTANAPAIFNSVIFIPFFFKS